MTKGNNRLVKRQRFSTSVDIALINTLEELSKKTRINKSKLVDEALELLFEKHEMPIMEDATE